MTDARNADAALLRAIEGDLVHYHRQRMAQRQGELMAQLRTEREKAAPDPAVIADLESAMVQVERDKRDPSITEREVLEPMRQRLKHATAG
ncbi:hypothetical protein [Stenotrophomonas acidaminiphila]|jgi:hypothetical protein|uniref:Uncharacterized protein n=1 Tax=Stenotrophomonas acidaminiphila TaxID=128780 RepID=A0A0S1AXT5_9GAMM|nr:hypothetical protein [Stenotrophomonas acidaminiphila]ALJ27633.1 hypothetical protein AOT14_12250 [Stenotrophomonas acidaminiphila]WHL19883.1 hypothetical protein QLF99_05555 [Stenotrophomonas acidaminiphila]